MRCSRWRVCSPSFLCAGRNRRRASGFYVCPNHFAGLLEVPALFCVSLVCWSRWPVWAKLLVGYAGVVCYAGLALTGSRGGYLSAGLSLGLVVFLTLVALRPAGCTVFWRTAAGGGTLCFIVGPVIRGGVRIAHAEMALPFFVIPSRADDEGSHSCNRRCLLAKDARLATARSLSALRRIGMTTRAHSP